MTIIQTTEYSPRANPHSDNALLISNKGSNFIKQEIRCIIEKIDQVRNQLFGSSPSAFDDKFASLKDRISLVESEFETNLIFTTDSQDIEFFCKSSLENLREITAGHWPIEIYALYQARDRVLNRIEFANKTFENYIDGEEELHLCALREKVENIITEAEEQLKTAKDNDTCMDMIAASKLSICEVIDDLELEIAKFSIPDTLNKMHKRICDINRNFKDLDFWHEEEKMRTLVTEMGDKIMHEQSKQKIRDLIEKTLDSLQEIDMEIEKAYAIREITKKYNELFSTATKLQQDGASITSELQYAMDRVEGSQMRIQGLRVPSSPLGMNLLAQLSITTNGTLSTLARVLKEMYIKYGEHCIRTAVDLLPFSNRLHQGVEEWSAIEKIGEKLVEKTKSELTWGTEGVNRAFPPIIPEQTMEEIIQDNLKKTSQSIYMAYVEQCIHKSLKFSLLRHFFEDVSEVRKNILRQKAEEFIASAKTELNELFLSMEQKGDCKCYPFIIKDFDVEKLVSKYISLLSQEASKLIKMEQQDKK